MTVADETPVLETTTAARLLKERLNLVEEHHSRDLQHAEAQVCAAVKELEILRQQAVQELERRAGRLRREHDAAMAALERRFRADAEALQVRRKESLLSEAERCQARIDARAAELLETLRTVSSSTRGSPAGRPASTHSQLTTAQQPPTPAACRQPLHAAVSAPLLTATQEGSAAVQTCMPRGPLKQGPLVLSQPVYHVAASAKAGDALAAAAPSKPPPFSCCTAGTARGECQGAHPSLDGTVAAGPLQQTTPGAPPTAAMRAGPRPQPHAAPRFNFRAGSAPGVGPCEGAAPRRHIGLPHESSSEYEDDSFLEDSGESSEEGLHTSRPPSVKLVNPLRSPINESTAGTPKALSLTCMQTASGGSHSASSRQVHLSLGVSSSPPLLVRACSPCTLRGGMSLGLPRPNSTACVLHGGGDSFSD